VVLASIFSLALRLEAAKRVMPGPGVIVAGLYPELAADLGLDPGQRGVIVLAVLRDSPAAAAGAREGDLVVSVGAAGGKATPVSDAASFDGALDRVSANKPVVLMARRGGQDVPIQFVRGAGTLQTPAQPDAAEKPRVLTVGKSGEFRSIDGAMLKARPADTVAVAAGRYPAVSVTRNLVTVASVDPQARAVVAGVTLSGVLGITIKDLDIEAATAGSGDGIAGTASRATIAGCTIKGFARGVSLGGRELTLDGNTFKENGWAVFGADVDSSWKIRRNVIAKNTGGIWVAGNVEIGNNTIIENRVSSEDFLKVFYKSQAITGVGILVNVPGSRALVFNNIMASNAIGVLLDPGVQATLEYNDIFMHTLGPATMKTGWALNNNHADLVAVNSNILSQIKYTSRKVGGDFVSTIEPSLSFQPSPTNMSADPLFADPMAGDYRLSADSPLVGRGRGKGDIGAFPAVGAPEAVGGRDARPGGAEPPSFGIAARPLTDADRQTLALPSLDGLWVTDVKKGSPAEALQLKPDDVIVAVNGKGFKSADEFKTLIASKVEALTVLREGKKMTLVKSMVF
jgi:membrane-associated protease RseP (regulator of RpoE activity)